MEEGELRRLIYLWHGDVSVSIRVVVPGLDICARQALVPIIRRLSDATSNNTSPKPYTERLFLGIAEYFEDFCDGKREEILAQNDILYAYAKEFRSYHLVADYASRICDTLNRLLLKVHEGGTKRKIISSSERRYERQTIQALALLIWKERVVIAIRNSHNNRLLYQVLESITRDRDGEDVSQDAIHTVVNSLVRLDEFIDQPRSLYIEEFERPYLIHTKNYYQREAARVIATNSISDYMIQANSRLIQEAARNKRFCHQTTHERAVKECEAQYVAAYQSRIQGEFEQMIHHERYEGKYCKLAYSLLSRLTDGLKELLEIYQSYITKLGKDILARLGQSVAKDPREYVESLLNLQSRYYAISNNVFSGDATFVAAVDKAFRAIINDTVTNKYAQGPELLAKYCDLLLKRGSAKKEASAVAAAGSKTAATQVNGADMVDADIDVEHRLTQLVILFKYVDDKDVFQKFYSRMLAKRLIYGTSISEEAEAGMIARLKASWQLF
ncbi:hypothetical protein BZG36_04779 [Bifiguratus adelaidae]|uniref:Cullin-5 n=1 Tax=Bifiguratus adelaidae TaxID=1938954 RepID=A0A261XWC1_9FUNG|nr:hypothetical protein BZG36_04779 [Bifiguratus adelaidae]